MSERELIEAARVLETAALMLAALAVARAALRLGRG